MLKRQRFGVEIEFTGISRGKTADLIAQYFNSTVVIGGRLDARSIRDEQGRSWQVVSDSSIRAQPSREEFKVEVVSPILVYEDIETIQEILRTLRKAGAKVNETCGIHIHIDGANHNAKSLKNIVNFIGSRQDLIYEALQVKSNRERYCKKLDSRLHSKIKSTKNIVRTDIHSTWYSPVNHGHAFGSGGRYNDTRYQGLNLHSFFDKGTVEFRMFNSTMHAGVLKTYIQFCLAVSAWAIENPDNVRFNKTTHYTPSQKVTIMNNVLTKRLGMVGEEFKTARLHLTKHLKTTAERMTA